MDHVPYYAMSLHVRIMCGNPAVRMSRRHVVKTSAVKTSVMCIHYVCSILFVYIYIYMILHVAYSMQLVVYAVLKVNAGFNNLACHVTLYILMCSY